MSVFQINVLQRVKKKSQEQQQQETNKQTHNQTKINMLGFTEVVQSVLMLMSPSFC